MKEYIRTTHNFDNNSRTWIYRGSQGEDKHEQWSSHEVCNRNTPFYYSLGVHTLNSGWWMSLDWIVSETITAFDQGASDGTEEFKEFVKTNPDYRKIIEKDVIGELEYLVSIDMVRVRVRETRL